MRVLTWVFVVFGLLELMNVAVLYGAPGSRRLLPHLGHHDRRDGRRAGACHDGCTLSVPAHRPGAAALPD